MKDDVARLKNLYLNQGYIDANIQASVDLPRNLKNKEAQADATAPRGEDFDPDEIPAEDLILTYRIEEGRQYRVGTLSVEGNTFFSTDDLMNELTADRAAVFRKAAGTALHLPIDRHTIQCAAGEAMAGVQTPLAMHEVLLHNVARYVLEHLTETWII